MEILLITVFVIGYLAITLEHQLKVDKLIPAIVMLGLSWGFIALFLDSFTNWFDPVRHALLSNFDRLDHESREVLLEKTLLRHLGKTAEILFFLLGAMTIVEIIDYFDGFSTMKTFIKAKSKVRVLWIMAILAFILSAIIDNLTATIVLLSILQKLVIENKLRMWFAGLIVIAANAGGAWSPVGDLTTTMLWIADKVTTIYLFVYLFLPSLVCMVLPTFIASKLPAFKGDIEMLDDKDEPVNNFRKTMLFSGLSAIIFVPIFKMITGLPPYVGMMLALGVVAVLAELLTNYSFKMGQVKEGKSYKQKPENPVHRSLSKVEMPSVLFFFGILMAVAALESVGILYSFANSLELFLPMMGTELHGEGVSDLVVLFLGVGSAVIDNVPLVAASLGMFAQPIDNELWHFIAYAAGTGGSMLIIGSAAGVVAMGMEKIDFFWYFKNISWLALIGFIAGAAVFMLTRTLI